MISKETLKRIFNYAIDNGNIVGEHIPDMDMIRVRGFGIDIAVREEFLDRMSHGFAQDLREIAEVQRDRSTD